MKSIFQAILNETFEDDLNDYNTKKDAFYKAQDRYHQGFDLRKKIHLEKTKFKIESDIYALDRDDYLRDSNTEDFTAYKNGEYVGRFRSPSLFIDYILNKNYGLHNINVNDVDTEDDLEQFKDFIGIWLNIAEKVFKAIKILNSLSFEKAIKDRQTAYNDANSAKSRALGNAKISLKNETPDFGVNDFAIWNSKNGPHKVTVLSIDEPNNRAKIKTNKGATMYVPLNTLDKAPDYERYSLDD